MDKAKKRLDMLVVEKGLADTRERARRLILSGSIQADGRPADKPGAMFAPKTRVALVRPPSPYVSRGGEKLAGALDAFALDVSGWTCMDVGASTGGFSDCLLQRGAARIYAVDVGYGQLAWKLRTDPRVTVLERTNIRHLPETAVPEPMDFIVVDVSFISLKIVIPAVRRFMHPKTVVVALVKPQFEVGKGMVGKGGVVRDPTHHEAVLKDVIAFFSARGMSCSRPVPSPLLGPKGNREFFLRLEVPPMDLDFSHSDR